MFKVEGDFERGDLCRKLCRGEDTDGCNTFRRPGVKVSIALFAELSGILTSQRNNGVHSTLVSLVSAFSPSGSSHRHVTHIKTSVHLQLEPGSDQLQIE